MSKMDKLERAIVPPSEVDRMINGFVEDWKSEGHWVRTAFPAATVEEARPSIVAHITSIAMDPVYRNNKYQVAVREVPCPWGDMFHLSIKRVDREPIHDWRDLQEIKNQLVGEEHEAIELYPAESRRVDSANQYHIWVLKEKGVKFPFGFNDRMITEEPLAGSKQRAFER